MSPRAPSPWPLLLSKLRQAHRAIVTHAELQAAGLDPAALFSARLIERVGAGRWTPPGCEHFCTPSLDFETRRQEGLVGVACPYEPACWPGVRWFPNRVVEIFACSAERVFEALRGLNGLSPLSTSLSPGVVPVGILERRGMRLPVVWMLQAFAQFPETCLGLRQRLGGDGLVVLLGRVLKSAPQPISPNPSVAVLELLADRGGDLHLHRALDLLDPRYRARRAEDPAALFDEVRLELAEEPGVRHIVRINGHLYEGFQKSDLKFARLLLLAAARKRDLDVEGGGWLPKVKLQGDEKDHDIEALRDELRKYGHPDLPEAERAALVKSSPHRDGRIRLAVLPTHIALDDSLAELQLIGEQLTESRGGNKPATKGREERAKQFARRDKVVMKILEEARGLGAPGPKSKVEREGEGGEESVG